jgi:predicted GNAT family acetyltransferase
VSRPVDDRPAWSITCFVIPKVHRRQGVASELLQASVEYARTQGAEVVEGYPIDPDKESVPAFWSWMGFASMFESAGFEEVARQSATRPLMRLELAD